jgi:excisionase family DNA binding protein
MDAVDTPSPCRTLPEAAHYLRVALSTLRRLIDAGQIIVTRPTPGRVLILQDDLDDYLRARREVAHAS